MPSAKLFLEYKFAFKIFLSVFETFITIKRFKASNCQNIFLDKHHELWNKPFCQSKSMVKIAKLRQSYHSFCVTTIIHKQQHNTSIKLVADRQSELLSQPKIQIMTTERSNNLSNNKSNNIYTLPTA